MTRQMKLIKGGDDVKRNPTNNFGNVIGQRNSEVNSIDPAEMHQTSIHCFRHKTSSSFVSN